MRLYPTANADRDRLRSQLQAKEERGIAARSEAQALLSAARDDAESARREAMKLSAEAARRRAHAAKLEAAEAA